VKINGVHHTSIWPHPVKQGVVCIIDQRQLPHRWAIAELRTMDEVATAIRDMWVRGAPLIGVTAAWGMYLASVSATGKPISRSKMESAARMLKATRPTAVNLAFALAKAEEVVSRTEEPDKLSEALRYLSMQLQDADVSQCQQIGVHGLKLIENIYARTGKPVQVMTHCNAGWLATVDWGTATSPIYMAHRSGIPVHVWVSETRPRNQGFGITAFELAGEGVPHTLLVDSAAGHLMQQGMVDMVIVGTDRTTSHGDVVNKIGTYLKALAAKASGVPFYVAAPSSSIDFGLASGDDVPIEQRDKAEVLSISDGQLAIALAPQGSKAVNFAFDVTPASLVTGLVTERGICTASKAGLKSLFPEHYGT
jgi:methylthioribose-1-phosphate isomerase